MDVIRLAHPGGALGGGLEVVAPDGGLAPALLGEEGEGTAAVGLASGKIDALVFLVGAGFGSLAFAALEPHLGSFPQAGHCDIGSLPQRLGVSGPIGAAALVVIAVAAFGFATRVEHWMARRTSR